MLWIVCTYIYTYTYTHMHIRYTHVYISVYVSHNNRQKHLKSMAWTWNGKLNSCGCLKCIWFCISGFLKSCAEWKPPFTSCHFWHFHFLWVIFHINNASKGRLQTLSVSYIFSLFTALYEFSEMDRFRNI